MQMTITVCDACEQHLPRPEHVHISSEPHPDHTDDPSKGRALVLVFHNDCCTGERHDSLASKEFPGRFTTLTLASRRKDERLNPGWTTRAGARA